MAKQRQDLTGKTFGRLTVIRFFLTKEFPCGQKHSVWWCKCVCGKEKPVIDGELTSGGTRSCGCLQREVASRNIRRRIVLHPSSPIYDCWRAIKRRCYNENRTDYRFYGGRGIKLCERWMIFQNFHNDMFPTWKPGLTIDRIDNELGYSPDNCRWATRKEQSNNRRSNRLVTFNGETKNCAQWAEQLGLSKFGVIYRLNAGWPISMALTKEKGYRFKPVPIRLRNGMGRYC